MLLDKEKIKESLTIDDIQLILNDLGSSEPKYDREGNLIFSTICHGGSKHKLYYYEDSKMFRCYTDCSDNYDIFSLVIAAKKQQGYIYNFPETVQYVANLTGKHYHSNTGRFGRSEEDKSTNKIDDWDWLEKIKKKDKVNVELPVYDEKVLATFLKMGYEEWEKEGISLETQRYFDIRYYVKNDSVIIPHRDINGNLIGIRQRNMRKEELNEGRKYTPVIVEGKQYNHPLGMNLYGLDKTKDAIQQTKKVMLFEGEKSVLKAQDFYGDMNFTTAVCSNNITKFQRDIVLSLEVEEIFIGFDKHSGVDDKEDIEKYKSKLFKFAKMFTPFARTYILWDWKGVLDFKQSPVDQGKKVFEKLMKQKVEIGT